MAVTGGVVIVIVLRLVITADLCELEVVAALGTLPGNGVVFVHHTLEEDLDVTGIVFVRPVDGASVLVTHVAVAQVQPVDEIGIVVDFVEGSHLFLQVFGHVFVSLPLERRRAALFFFFGALSVRDRQERKYEFHLLL